MQGPDTQSTIAPESNEEFCASCWMLQLPVHPKAMLAVQGPTISPVYTHGPGDNGSTDIIAQHGFYAATICVPKKLLYQSVKELREVSMP